MGLEVGKGVSLFLGAGASCDYGFPTGKQLMQDIAKALTSPDKCETGAYLYKYSNHETGTLSAAGTDLQNALQQRAFESIDAFLEQRRHQSPDVVDICRQAVWCLILESERHADLFPEHDWMLDFFDTLFGDAKTIGAARDVLKPLVDSHRVGISVYTLNYDRLLERKLICYLKGRYGDTEEVADNIEPMLSEITHSHGSLGPITSDGELAFGAELPSDRKTFMEAAQRLKFWFEMSSEHWTWNISKLFSFRETLLLLGYGFHPSINSRFDPNRSNDSKLSRIYGSCFGLPTPKREALAEWIEKTFVVTSDGIRMGQSDHRCHNLIELIKNG